MRRPGPSDLWPLALGVAAVVGATVLGSAPRLLEAIVSPPPALRALLAVVAVVVAVGLLRAAIDRIGADVAAPDIAARDLPRMVRGVRLVFLAVAAAAAAAGWLLGHPLPIVVALLIGGVDVVETSFLLLVVRARRQPGERVDRQDG